MARVDGANPVKVPKQVQSPVSNSVQAARPGALPSTEEMMENGLQDYSTAHINKASLDHLSALLPAAAASNQAITGTDAAGKKFDVRVMGDQYAVKAAGTFAPPVLVDTLELTRMLSSVSVQPASAQTLQALRKHDAQIAALKSQPTDKKLDAVVAFLKSEPNATPAQLKRWAAAFTPAERQRFETDLEQKKDRLGQFVAEGVKTDQKVKDEPGGSLLESFNPLRAVGSAMGLARPPILPHQQGVHAEIGRLKAELQSGPTAAKAKLLASLE